MPKSNRFLTVIVKEIKVQCRNEEIATATFLFLVMVILNLPFDIPTLGKSILMLINSTLVFYVLGLLIPVGRKNPYMGILSFSILIFALLPVAFIMTYVLNGISTSIIALLIIVVEILLSCAFYFVSNWRFRNG